MNTNNQSGPELTAEIEAAIEREVATGGAANLRRQMLCEGPRIALQHQQPATNLSDERIDALFHEHADDRLFDNDGPRDKGMSRQDFFAALQSLRIEQPAIQPGEGMVENLKAILLGRFKYLSVDNDTDDIERSFKEVTEQIAALFPVHREQTKIHTWDDLTPEQFAMDFFGENDTNFFQHIGYDDWLRCISAYGKRAVDIIKAGQPAPSQTDLQREVEEAEEAANKAIAMRPVHIEELQQMTWPDYVHHLRSEWAKGYIAGASKRPATSSPTTGGEGLGAAILADLTQWLGRHVLGSKLQEISDSVTAIAEERVRGAAVRFAEWLHLGRCRPVERSAWPVSEKGWMNPQDTFRTTAELLTTYLTSNPNTNE